MTDAPRSTLYLLRHAHSSWALPGQRDHQRPLDARGRDNALTLGPAIQGAGYQIGAVVCSTAVRAEETLAAFRSHLPAQVPIVSSDALYALGAEAYLAAVQEHGDTQGLLLVGHNPMIEEFALSLAGDGEPAALQSLGEGFSTACLAVIEFATPLAAIGDGTGYLRRLLHPRDHGG